MTLLVKTVLLYIKLVKYLQQIKTQMNCVVAWRKQVIYFLNMLNMLKDKIIKLKYTNISVTNRTDPSALKLLPLPW